MAFSDTFGLGGSTFDELESQIKRAIDGEPDDIHKLSNKISTASKYEKTEVEHFTQFFESDFALSLKDAEESLVRVSQIEAGFVNDDMISALDMPISSEDVRDLQTEEITEDVCGVPLDEAKMAVSEAEAKMALSEAEELPQLDESRFICPTADSSDRSMMKLQLEASKLEIKLGRSEIKADRTRNVLNRSEQLNISARKLTQQTNISTPQDFESLKHISAWNLPQSILLEYEKKGIMKMFDWQIECLSNTKVLFEHCNLVYSAPTSAGKTLVSEILLLKTVLERDKKVLMILPFISVVREKMLYLQDLLTPAGYRVEGFYGGYTPPGGFDSINVAICTIEKANSIVNKLLEQGKLECIGTVVVDEIHLISDPNRGYILELLLAKILYTSRKYGFPIQIITMSATLANVELLKRWLDAELYITDYRPVALQEMIKVGTKVFDCNMTLLRDLTDRENPLSTLPNDSDNVAQMCLETLLEGCSVIVFCPSKDWCEKLALQLASMVHGLGKGGTELGQRLRAQLKREAIDEMKRRLSELPTGLDAVLEKTATYGCAFHHAGLTTEERDIVETSFKCGALKILVATSTLSSGVNLPARRVLIRTPLFGGKQMSSLTYRQMIGRAGRTGKDTLGESILICTDSNARIGRNLITEDLKPITSCLEMDSSIHLKRALLEVIAAGVTLTKADIDCFVNCTLLSAQKLCNLQEKDSSGGDDDENSINAALDFLIEYEFVRLQRNETTNEQHYVATRLGLACLASSMPPTDGLILFAELQKSRRCFVLESELHAVYLVTPYSVCYQMQEIDWLFYLELWEKLTPAMRKVGELVGVKESFLVRAMRGLSKLDYKQMQIHKRFYTALALQELVEETPINLVAQKYKCTRGLLQSLQQMSSTFAGIVTAFCNALSWDTLSLIVSQFKERLFFGIHRDLIDLVRLPDLNHKRARVLFDGGITTLVELAHADMLTVEKLLHNALSFDSAKQHDNENAYEAAQRNLVRNFFITGKAGLTVQEAAKLLVQAARQFVAYEIGIKGGGIKWTQAAELHNEKDEELLHMSCEEHGVKTADNKRKSCEDLNETPPKVEKVDGKEKPPEEMPQKTEIYKEMSQKTNYSKEATVNNLEKHKQKVTKDYNGNTVITERSKVETKPNAITVEKPAKPQTATLETSSNTADVVPNSLPKAITSNHSDATKTGNVTPKRRYQNNAKGTPKSLSLVKSRKAVFNAENQKPNALKEINAESFQDAIELSNMSNATYIKENENVSKTAANNAAKSTKSTQSDVENQSKTTHDILTPNSNQQIHYSLRKYTAQRRNITTTVPEITPNHSPTAKTLQLANKPRRSPRNHATTTASLTASTRKNVTQLQQQTHIEQDLFATDDDSFELNSGITAALHLADQLAGSKEAPIISPTAEEVPSSPQPLRSYRTQRVASASLQPLEILQVESLATNDTSLKLTDSPYAMQMNASHILSCEKQQSDANEATNSIYFKSLDIIDICGDRTLFDGAFQALLQAKRFGCCLGLEKLAAKRKPQIGANLLINQVSARDELASTSLLFPIDDDTYLSSIAFCLTDNVVFYMNMQMETKQEQKQQRVATETKLEYLKKLLRNSALTLLIFEARKQLKLLRKAIPKLSEILVKLEDPKVANWLLQPDQRMTLKNLAQQFAPECTALVELLGAGRGYNSFGIDAGNAISVKQRCAIESCVVVHVLQGQLENLARIGNGELQKFFYDLEMPLQLSLCNMELSGFPASEMALRDLHQRMLTAIKKLETRIFQLHGKRFNLGSTSAVGRVLGLLRKPSGRVCTSRQVLEKIDSPIAQLIIVYRKLSATLSKNIQPLLQTVQHDRIHGQSDTFTATGRISMKEPNLQNVAKDFEIDYGNEKTVISCRRAFFPKDSSRMLISADFCQLEMRILAHMAKDPHLIKIMSAEQDVFTAIAAGWNGISESQVSEQLRNGTKQICYGIIYGMGMRSLADALGCSETEAKEISTQFHAAYPAIRSFTNKIVDFARRNGYIETIQGRRRYLEHINSEELGLKNQAERQAVNSAIQGSAADIAKKAILRTEKNMLKYHTKLNLTPQDVQFVLHIHDELVFEVSAVKAKKIAKIISLTMEACTKLDVPLKVKLKMGRSWGDMKQLES